MSFILDDRETESDDLSSSKTSQFKLGLQKGFFQNSLKPRAKKMEGEQKKSGAKIRSKPIETGFDSDDNEPISFRKRLKGPKKDIGSVSVRPVEDNMDNGCCEGGDVLGLAINEGVVEHKSKVKVKKTKIGSKRERNRGDAPVYDTLETLGSQIEDQKEEGSLPSGFKSFFGSKGGRLIIMYFSEGTICPTQKSHMSSCSKQNSRVQNLEDGLSPTSECISELSKSVVARISRTASASNVVCKDLKAEDGCTTVTYLSSSNFVSEHSKTVKHQRHDNRFCQSSNCMEVFHCRGIKDERLVDHGVSNVKEESMMDPCVSNRVCDENCSFSGQVDSLDVQSLKNGLMLCSIRKVNTLVHDVVKVPTSASVQFEDIDGFCDQKSNKVLRDAWDHQSKNVSTPCISKAENQISFSSSRKEISQPSMVDEIPNKLCRCSSDRIHKPAYEGILGGSLNNLSSNSSQHYARMEKAAKTETALDFDQCPKACLHVQPHLADSTFASPKIEETCGDCDVPNGYGDKSYLASVSPKRKNAATSDGKLCLNNAMSDEVDKDACNYQMNHRGNSETFVHPSESSISIQKHSPVLHQSIHSEDATKGNCVPSHDYLSINEETNGASSMSITPEENESCPEDAVSIPDSEIKDGKLSSVQRGARKAKKRRLGTWLTKGILIGKS
ncbi:hypothetical protein GH714_015951 [Hevea brasiliensis]|uniref:Uncharacterized protein n=1 Tax=Hevea brasiliensis TaxID=3981 RepID=A0A6A6NHU9_HEVBR|nr:hypothetical protein GH714_015951 [Hevea brasiliensis]